MRFSIVIVCFNAGEKLNQTVENVLCQSMTDYEIVIKDGMSTDGSVEAAAELIKSRGAAERLKLIREKDAGIYDAMNAATKHATGEYFIFMNCGDYFYDDDVLRRVSDKLDALRAPDQAEESGLTVLYGNRYLIPTKSVEYVSPRMTPLTCYRNVPCHQCCFYQAACFAERGYRTYLKVRADYEHILWLYFSKKARFIYLDDCVAKYEGGGYSETPESVKRSEAEHREITRKYMTRWQLFYCKAYMILTLQPLRHFLATDPVMSKAYNGLIRGIYKVLKRR